MNRIRGALAAVALVAAAGLGWHHVEHVAAGSVGDLELIVAAAFVALVYTTVVPHFHRDATVTAAQRATLAARRLLCVVPAHHEDPAMFVAMLDSVLTQTRTPDRLHIVENGGDGYTPTLAAIVEAWTATHRPAFEVRYDFHPVADKRLAQALAVQADPDAQYVMTLDSDVELGDPETIERGMAPFASRRVMSVCGFLVGKNHRKSLLTRLVELGFVCSFLNGRASYSMLGQVAVNTGGLAWYRAKVWRKYLDHYLGHRVFGRRMSYGDDAMMTRYSLLEGRVVFQRGAWGYTLHPENLAHLTKQRLRWHRSWVWGNLWLLRHFDPRSAVWLLTLWQGISFIWFTAAIPAVLLIAPATTGVPPWMFFGWLALIAYVSMLPALGVDRPDTTRRQLLAAWALAPLAALLNIYLGWALRYVGLATCLKTGWSTRQHIEVGLTNPDDTVVIPAGWLGTTRELATIHH